jgi:hypothetical protein
VSLRAVGFDPNSPLEVGTGFCPIPKPSVLNSSVQQPVKIESIDADGRVKRCDRFLKLPLTSLDQPSLIERTRGPRFEFSGNVEFLFRLDVAMQIPKTDSIVVAG